MEDRRYRVQDVRALTDLVSGLSGEDRSPGEYHRVGGTIIPVTDVFPGKKFIYFYGYFDMTDNAWHQFVPRLVVPPGKIWITRWVYQTTPVGTVAYLGHRDNWNVDLPLTGGQGKNDNAYTLNIYLLPGWEFLYHGANNGADTAIYVGLIFEELSCFGAELRRGVF